MNLLELWSKLPVRTIALVVHAVLYLALSLAMLVAVDGYLAYDDGHTSSTARRPTFRSSDIITFVSAATMAVSWMAGIWSASVLVKSGYVVWVGSRDNVNKEIVADKIRRTMDHQLPLFLGTRRDFTLVQISTLLIIPAFIASPLLQGALDWRSSSEATGFTILKSRNPAAEFWGWSYLDGNARDADEENWGAASLAGITWDGLSESTDTSDKQTCRHVISHAQFLPGSKLFGGTFPCIIVHSISFPSAPVPPEAIHIVDNPRLITTSKAWRLFGEVPGTLALFDPTNKSLPIPPVLGSDIPDGDIVFTSEPTYPSPFSYSGTMTGLVLIAMYKPYPPYQHEIFGIPPPPNSLPRGAVMSFADGQGIRPDRHFVHMVVNFTAGVIHPKSATYLKRNVIEADDHDPDGKDIVPASWVKEALYMMSDTMNCMVRMNTTAIPTWGNLENYARDMIRYSYMAAWTNLQRRFEPNSTDLAVEIQEPRLRAVVSRWRVIVWMLINVAFSSSWFLVAEMRRRNGEIGEVDGFADFVLRMYAWFEGEGRGRGAEEREGKEGMRITVMEDKGAAG
ncbi:hypothetical protein B0T14DRAFT_559324 [Immersiella caudata]|uniref:Uncharacterized protein n=1 Tax=Immersiella caudata TaxID=314043 RepID=A0AA40CAG4_9PEZI|nr:hypothetical protein B0T14DRAFT_559324 [Immersiella caudata]